MFSNKGSDLMQMRDIR